MLDYGHCGFPPRRTQVRRRVLQHRHAERRMSSCRVRPVGAGHNVQMRMRRSHQPAMDWATIGQELFDRIVEALVQRVYDDTTWDVRPIDGRGGDDGIDIECLHKTSGHRHVHQLKYFPEGFSGKHVKRRDQI